MRVALVHDYLYVHGGAERALEALHDEWPDAPIFTTFFLRDRLPSYFAHWDVRTTFIDRLPNRLRWQRAYAPLHPLAFATVDLRDYDVVISAASYAAKTVRPPDGALHICYCYTPPRFLWGPASGIERGQLPAPVRPALRGVEAMLRWWDAAAARRVDLFVAQSHAVAARIERIYRRRPAAVVYPPINVERFAGLAAEDRGYFLVISRFEAYKRIDLAIEACNRLKLPLKVVGDGVDRPRLAKLAGPTVELLGTVADREVDELFASCRAVIFPGEEDFGLVPLEAQAAGKPVIAYGAGGALETVRAGVTGELFTPQSVQALAAALAAFHPGRYDPAACRAHAAAFSPLRFRREIAAVVHDAWRAHAGKHPAGAA